VRIWRLHVSYRLGPEKTLCWVLVRSLYAAWMNGWESRLANADQNRVAHPFEWGWDWLDLAVGSSLDAFSGSAAAESDRFFDHKRRVEFDFDGATLRFESEAGTPYPENNRVEAEYLPAREARGRAVVVIPQWNSDARGHIGLCKLLNRFGLSALRLSPAYHHSRKPPHLKRADYHVSANVGRTIHATRQSVLDARGCIDWLESRGYERIGILGSSLGSCIALLAAAHDPRIRAGVFNHVSAWFADAVWTGVSCRHIRAVLDPHVTQEELRRCWAVISPASYLDRLAAMQPFPKLLIWASLDTTFRPEYSQLAIEGFRRRGIPHKEVCLPCGHYTIAKFPFNWWDGLTMARFLSKNL